MSQLPCSVNAGGHAFRCKQTDKFSSKEEKKKKKRNNNEKEKRKEKCSKATLYNSFAERERKKKIRGGESS